jgi:hypothetical protein
VVGESLGRCGHGEARGAPISKWQQWQWWVAVLCAFAAVALAGSAPAPAAEIEFGWSGTVIVVDPSLAAALPPDSGIAPGANAWVAFVFESTTPDANPDPSHGDYPGALVSWTLQVGSFVFTRDAGGPTNQIEILRDPLLTVYQSASSVVATPPLPGFPTVESDVLFLSFEPSPLPSDELPLAPLDPAVWDDSLAGILDPATGDPLIDIDLTAICTGACQPPLPEPVPMLGPLAHCVAAIALLLTGAACLRR